jgi:holo-[acyl-carrier protein] synthase
MIVGVGIDIIEVARVQSVADRFGDRFLNRILRPGEIASCRTFTRLWPHVAARFAAKEAVSKAFGTGIGAALGWQDIEVTRYESGQPYLVLHGGGRSSSRTVGQDRPSEPEPRRTTPQP